MGREEEAYVMGSSRGRRLPMVFVLLAVVVAMVAVAIGGALGGGRAVAAPAATDATIEATSFSVAGSERDERTGEEFAVCPGNKRALGGGVVQSGPAQGVFVRASGPLNSGGVTAKTVSGSIPKQWYAAVGNGSGQQRDLKVFAVCE